MPQCAPDFFPAWMKSDRPIRLMVGAIAKGRQATKRRHQDRSLDLEKEQTLNTGYYLQTSGGSQFRQVLTVLQPRTNIYDLDQEKSSRGSPYYSLEARTELYLGSELPRSLREMLKFLETLLCEIMSFYIKYVSLKFYGSDTPLIPQRIPQPSRSEQVCVQVSLGVSSLAMGLPLGVNLWLYLWCYSSFASSVVHNSIVCRILAL